MRARERWSVRRRIGVGIWGEGARRAACESAPVHEIELHGGRGRGERGERRREGEEARRGAHRVDRVRDDSDALMRRAGETG